MTNTKMAEHYKKNKESIPFGNVINELISKELTFIENKKLLITHFKNIKKHLSIISDRKLIKAIKNEISLNEKLIKASESLKRRTIIIATKLRDPEKISIKDLNSKFTEYKKILENYTSLNSQIVVNFKKIKEDIRSKTKKNKKIYNIFHNKGKYKNKSKQGFQSCLIKSAQKLPSISLLYKEMLKEIKKDKKTRKEKIIEKEFAENFEKSKNKQGQFGENKKYLKIAEAKFMELKKLEKQRKLYSNNLHSNFSSILNSTKENLSKLNINIKHTDTIKYLQSLTKNKAIKSILKNKKSTFSTKKALSYLNKKQGKILLSLKENKNQKERENLEIKKKSLQSIIKSLSIIKKNKNVLQDITNKIKDISTLCKKNDHYNTKQYTKNSENLNKEINKTISAIVKNEKLYQAMKKFKSLEFTDNEKRNSEVISIANFINNFSEYALKNGLISDKKLKTKLESLNKPKKAQEKKNFSSELKRVTSILNPRFKLRKTKALKARSRDNKRAKDEKRQRLTADNKRG